MKQDSTIHSLKQGILKFQKRIAHLLLPISCLPPAVARPHDDGLTAHNCLESLEQDELIATQLRRRIHKMMKEEAEGGFTQQNLGKEVLALTTLEKTIIKQRDWILRHPGQDPVEKMKEQKREAGIVETFENYMDNSTAEGRENLMEASNKFIELCEQNALTLEIDDDGNYAVLPPDFEQ